MSFQISLLLFINQAKNACTIKDNFDDELLDEVYNNGIMAVWTKANIVKLLTTQHNAENAITMKNIVTVKIK